MKEKKSAVITFRTEEWVKEFLQKTADLNHWSIAQTVNEICQYFATNPQPGEITIRISDLSRIVDQVKKEQTNTVTLEIGLYDNEEEKIEKCLTFTTLECGGMGACSDFDRIIGLTQEEIESIP